jgi:glycerol-3-phosphate dehydrogenase
VTGTPPGAADVAIVGAGVVGTAIARALSRYDLSVVVVDGANDVGTGTTKANTAILHTGFDAVPGTLESRLLRRGNALLCDYAARAGIPVERTGALLVAWTPEQRQALPGIERKARQNGYTRVSPVSAASLYQREPHLGPGALAALEIPDESIVCPWTTPLAYATEAVRAGVRLQLDSMVTGVGDEAGAHSLTTTRGTIRCRWLVNAAGLGADRIDAMLGGGGGFTVLPRRGELIVFDKLARPLLGSILLPVPTAQTKGVLVATGRTPAPRRLAWPACSRRARRSSRTWSASRSPRPMPGCGPRPGSATTRSGSTPRCATPASLASGPPGCPRLSASPSTWSISWPGPGWR